MESVRIQKFLKYIPSSPAKKNEIEKMIHDFVSTLEDCQPLTIKQTICNKKVYHGFRCLTCESIETDGSSKFIFLLSSLKHMLS